MFFRCCKAIVKFALFKNSDSLHISTKTLFFTNCFNFFFGKVIIVSVGNRYLRVQIKGICVCFRRCLKCRLYIDNLLAVFLAFYSCESIFIKENQIIKRKTLKLIYDKFIKSVVLSFIGNCSAHSLSNTEINKVNTYINIKFTIIGACESKTNIGQIFIRCVIVISELVIFVFCYKVKSLLHIFGIIGSIPNCFPFVIFKRRYCNFISLIRQVFHILIKRMFRKTAHCNAFACIFIYVSAC